MRYSFNFHPNDIPPELSWFGDCCSSPLSFKNPHRKYSRKERFGGCLSQELSRTMGEMPVFKKVLFTAFSCPFSV